MKYRSEIKLNPEILNFHCIIDEQIFKELATKIINEMSLDELKKVFKFNKEDPFKDGSSAFHDYNILFKAEINTPD